MQSNISSNFTSAGGMAVSKSLIRAFTSMLLILISITGNALVLSAMIINRYRKLQTIPNLIIMNLSVADMLFSLIVVPINTFYWLQDQMIPTVVTCHITGVAACVFGVTSIYTLVFVSIERFVATNYPLKHRYMFNRKVVKIGSFCIWLWCTFLSAIPFTTSRYVYIEKFFHCAVDWENDLLSTLVYVMFGSVFPFATLVFCNANVLRAVRKAQRERALHLNTFQKAENNRLRKETGISLLVVAVIITFVLCWTPYIISMLCLARGNCTLPQEFMSAAVVLTIANGACNPILYGVMNKNFRNTFKDILCCRARPHEISA